jgi:hypothetical protein
MTAADSCLQLIFGEEDSAGNRIKQLSDFNEKQRA